MAYDVNFIESSQLCVRCNPHFKQKQKFWRSLDKPAAAIVPRRCQAQAFAKLHSQWLH